MAYFYVDQSVFYYLGETIFHLHMIVRQYFKLTEDGALIKVYCQKVPLSKSFPGNECTA